jgi:flagellar protein FliO/FliZ
MRKVGQAFAAVLALAAPAYAAVDDAKIIFPGVSSPASAPVTGAGFGSVTLLVGLVLAGVGLWLVWRVRSGAPVGREVSQLAILETRSLGNRQYLVIAAYEEKKFMLGVCPGRIDLLAPLAAPADEKDSRS